jgi:hypothetical protein
VFWQKQRKLEEKIMELEKKIQQLSNEKPPQPPKRESQDQRIEYHFHIEHIDIHQPTMEELSFRLDELDIEELSGSLNIGNNFASPPSKRKTSREDEQTINSTNKGYSVSFNEKGE